MDRAIAQLEAQILPLMALNQGRGPDPDSSEYFLLQALSFGLSLLRASQAQRIDTDTLRRKVRKDLNV